MNLRWKRGEFWYCRQLVAGHGDENVGAAPQTVATYLRLQSSGAYADGEIEICARLATAAVKINEDARNSHQPRWDEALEVLTPEGVEIGSLEDTGTCTASAARIDRVASRARRSRRRDGSDC